MLLNLLFEIIGRSDRILHLPLALTLARVWRVRRRFIYPVDWTFGGVERSFDE